MITVDYIKANQQENQHIEVMKKIILYINELLDEQNINEMDYFILEFSNAEICFQYHVCLITAVFVYERLLKNFDALVKKAIEVGTKEIGKENALHTLRGLI